MTSWAARNPERARESALRWRAANRSRYLEAARKAGSARYLVMPVEKRMLRGSLERARRFGVPHSISAADILVPEVCPILGIPLFCSVGCPTDNSPTLDRIDPKLGYVPGNVAVISNRANRIKNDATVDELRKVADWLSRQTFVPLLCPSTSATEVEARAGIEPAQ